MLKEIIKLQHFCDVCGKESNEWNKCMSCNKNICYECKKTSAKEYTHSVWASGIGDGLYCLDCDKKLLNSGDKKHQLYRLIESLKHESNGFYNDFKKRAESTEKELKNS